MLHLRILTRIIEGREAGWWEPSFAQGDGVFGAAAQAIVQGAPGQEGDAVFIVPRDATKPGNIIVAGEQYFNVAAVRGIPPHFIRDEVFATFTDPVADREFDPEFDFLTLDGHRITIDGVSIYTRVRRRPR